jgi:hypothetical protein
MAIPVYHASIVHYTMLTSAGMNATSRIIALNPNLQTISFSPMLLHFHYSSIISSVSKLKTTNFPGTERKQIGDLQVPNGKPCIDAFEVLLLTRICTLHSKSDRFSCNYRINETQHLANLATRLFFPLPHKVISIVLSSSDFFSHSSRDAQNMGVSRKGD